MPVARKDPETFSKSSATAIKTNAYHSNDLEVIRRTMAGNRVSPINRPQRPDRGTRSALTAKG